MAGKATIRFFSVLSLVSFAVLSVSQAADDTLRRTGQWNRAFTPLDVVRGAGTLILSGLDKELRQTLINITEKIPQNTPNFIDFAKAILESGVMADIALGGRYPDSVTKLQGAAKTFKDPSAALISSAVESIEPIPATTAVALPEVSPLCLNHTFLMLKAVVARLPWALKMIDADGKPNPNIYGLNIFWIGAYDECLAVTAQSLNSSEDDILFKGKYCTSLVPLSPTDFHPLIPAVPSTGLHAGVCVPDSCNGQDITFIINSILESRNVSLRVGLTSCQERILAFDTKAIVVLFVCSLFILLLVVGTAYDVAVVQWPKWYPAGGSVYNSYNKNGYTPIGSSSITIVNNNMDNAEADPLIGKSINERLAPGVCGNILLAFSVYTNGRKLLIAKHAPGSLPCIHGIRFFSMTWVILGHTFVFGLPVAGNFIEYIQGSLKLWTFQAILGAPVAVDTFFAVSGLLVTYLIMKEMERRDGKVQWFLFYFHRFWRLTPPYMLVLMMLVALLRYMGDGPNWPQDGTEFNSCSNTWWTNLLYINNFVRVKEMCFNWSWYLANDMQFYIISPLIFIPLYHWRRVGLFIAGLFLLATLLTAGIIARVNKFPPSIGLSEMNVEKSADYFSDFYIKPYCRFGPYVIGMLTGWLLFKTKCKVTMSRTMNLLGWAMATAVALAVVYGLHDATRGNPLTADGSAAYNALHGTAWAVSVCWVIFACSNGYGGPVNAILSWEALVPLSRLTFMAYLIHPIIMNFYYLSGNTLFYMSHLNCAMAFLSFTVTAFALAFALSLAFEAPMIGLEKVLLKRHKE